MTPTRPLQLWWGVMNWQEDFCIGIWAKQWYFNCNAYRYEYRAGIKLGIVHLTVQWRSPFQPKQTLADAEEGKAK